MKELELLVDLGQRKSTPTSKRSYRWGLYKCRCGDSFETRIGDVKSGKTRSCGCYQPRRKVKEFTNENRSHKKTYHRLYNRWHQMIQRCHNPTHHRYKDYGARGISVCIEWRNIENFINDMYSTFIEGLTLDRKDNQLGYSKDNCRWATSNIQQRNSRRIRRDNNSGYRGVSIHKGTQKFIAQIVVNSKQVHLGLFKTTLEAAKAYDKYVIDNNLEHTMNFS